MPRSRITKDENGEEKVEQVNQPEGAPTMGTNKPLPREALAHIWQEDSPALNTNIQGPYASSEKSILDQIDTEEKQRQRKEDESKEPEKQKVTKAEFDRRTKLDVSDPLYVNPSLDHYEVEE